jgi:hypothetical protein
MTELDERQYTSLNKNVMEKYGYFLNNFSAESKIWYSYFKAQTDIKYSKDILDTLKEAELFYPTIFTAICTGLSIQATTYTAERSFSTLRRIKTWLRSIMADKRLHFLCMLHIHNDLINSLISDHFYENIVDCFEKDARRLQFFFQQE